MKFKQGDTFDCSGEVEIVAGAGDPVNLTGWSVESKVSFPETGETVSLTAVFVGVGNTHVRVSHTDTEGWPHGPADIDIQFTSTGGAVVSTETLRFCIVEDVT